MGYDKCDISGDDESEAARITVERKNMRKQNESYLRTTTTKNRFELSM